MRGKSQAASLALPQTVAPADSPRAARLVLVAILGFAALLRLWHLDQNGHGRQYYAAGVRSMLGSWHALLFNAFDPAGFVSLDKPPIALWMQVASAKVLGFSPFSVMLPQVLEGLASVALVHHLVARRFGQTAALLAALFLALTPIVVAIDRSNNTDSCLIMVLLLAAWALIHAAEKASVGLLVLTGVLVGVGFNVKMAAALVLVPTFGLVYLCTAPRLSMQRRLSHLALAAVAMAVVSMSWVGMFDLTAPSQRPYAGSTKHNSMLELALMHNGLDRFIHRSAFDAASGGGGGAPTPASVPDVVTQPASPSAQEAPLWDKTPVGPLRLATPHLVAQMGWWLPLVAAGVVSGGSPWPWRRRLSAAQAQVVVWTGWAFTFAAAFSFAGGVFHTYYVAVLGPPLAALAGIGASWLWQRWRADARSWTLPAMLAVMAAWQVHIEQANLAWQLEGWRGAMLVAVVTVLVLAAAGLRLLPPPRVAADLSSGLAMTAVLAVLAMPLAWALSTVLARPNVAAPAADITRLFDGTMDAAAAVPPAAARPRVRKLLEFLRAQRRSERFLLAVPNALLAAPFIVRTGESVMALGGYLGRDPILTPDQLERRVQAGELRYVILGGPFIVPPDTRGERLLADWIRTHGQPVDPALWRDDPEPDRPPDPLARRPGSPVRLYDLRPDATHRLLMPS